MLYYLLVCFTTAEFYAMDGGEAAFAEYAEIVAGDLCEVLTLA